MKPQRQRVVVVTGASSGIGQACAGYLAQRGHQVFGTSRHPPLVGAETSTMPGRVMMIQMNVDSDDSVQRGVELIVQRAGRIDVVVNNAGFGITGAVEDTTIEEAKAQFESNFFGVWRVCRAVLPIMRRQRSGYLVNISSLAGVIGLPFHAAYSASKFAVEGFSEALSAEVRPFGIHVALIEPGNFVTSFTARRRTATQAQQPTIYRERFTRSLAIIETAERNGLPPERVAHLVTRIIATPSPRLRYTVGSPVERAAPLLKKLLPGRLFEWVLMRAY